MIEEKKFSKVGRGVPTAPEQVRIARNDCGVMTNISPATGRGGDTAPEQVRIARNDCEVMTNISPATGRGGDTAPYLAIS